MARPAGSTNKATTKAREAFQALLDSRIDQLGEWLDRIAKDDPAAAFRLFMDVAKYCVARPAPVALVEPNEAPVLTVRFVDPPPCTTCGHEPHKDPVP